MGLGRPVLGAGRKYSQHSAEKRECKHFGCHWPLTHSFFLKKVPVPLPKKLAMPLPKNEG
jgi:hypothetical protein